MSLSKRGFGFVVLAIAMTACEDGKGPGNPDAYQGKQGGGAGNECSQQFVSDYNEVGRTARYLQADLQMSDTSANRAQARRDAQSLKEKATAFKSKYAGVACVATPENSDAKETIDANQRMDVAIQYATTALKNLDQPASGGSTSTTRQSRPTGPEQCSSAFLNEYLAVTNYAKAVSEDLDLPNTAANREKTRTDAEALKTQAKAFKVRYPGFKCDVGSGSTRYSIDVNVRMDELVATAESVIALLDGGGSAAPAAALFAPSERPAILPIRLINR